MAYDLLAIGDLNLDLFLQVERFPKVDDEVEVQSYLRLPGGDAANVAAAAAKLGLKSAILGCIGQDEEGEFLDKALQNVRVDTRFVQKSANLRTGMVTAAVRADGQRNLYTYRGANAQRKCSADFEQALADCDLLHLSDPLAAEVEVLSVLLQRVKTRFFSIDPGAITSARGLPALLPLLNLAAVCFINEGELVLLTGCEKLEEALSVLLASGPHLVVVKQGGKGCLVCTHGSQINVPAFRTHPVDATGAGDAFDAGFLYSLHKGSSLLDAGRFANAVGALTTRSLGAQSAQPTLDEVNAFLSGD